jgi:hypothetical protein
VLGKLREFFAAVSYYWRYISLNWNGNRHGTLRKGWGYNVCMVSHGCIDESELDVEFAFVCSKFKTSHLAYILEYKTELDYKHSCSCQN